MPKTTRSRLTPLCRTPELTEHEQHDLFRRMQPMKHARRHRREFERLRNRIAAANLRLLIAIARQFVTPQLSLDELVSAGALPLLRAVELFDPSRGYQFSTYATHAVRNYLLRVRKQAARRLSRETGAEPDVVESLQELCPSEDGAAIIHREEFAAIQAAMSELPQRDRQLIACRFGLDDGQASRTFKELATLFGLSRERVRVLTNRALQRLRESLDERSAIGLQQSESRINHQR